LHSPIPPTHATNFSGAWNEYIQLFGGMERVHILHPEYSLDRNLCLTEVSALDLQIGWHRVLRPVNLSAGQEATNVFCGPSNGVDDGADEAVG
jgi:hypothetical protein